MYLFNFFNYYFGYSSYDLSNNLCVAKWVVCLLHTNFDKHIILVCEHTRKYLYIRILIIECYTEVGNLKKSELINDEYEIYMCVRGNVNTYM